MSPWTFPHRRSIFSGSATSLSAYAEAGAGLFSADLICFRRKIGLAWICGGSFKREKLELYATADWTFKNYLLSGEAVTVQCNVCSHM